MKSGDIISMVTVSGEFVGRYLGESSVALRVGEPHMVTPTENSMGFLPMCCLTGERNPDEVEFQKSGIVFFMPTDESVVKEFRRATSGIIT